MKLIIHSILRIFILTLKRIPQFRTDKIPKLTFLLLVCVLLKPFSAVAGDLIPHRNSYIGNKILKIISKNEGFSLSNKLSPLTPIIITENSRFNKYLTMDNIVKGKVTNSKGEPLIGVSVTVKGTTVGVSTDEKGYYSIDVPAHSSLVFYYVGFATKETPVNDRSKVDIVMEESVLSLDQVVVVGYGKQKVATVTGSITTVNGSKLEKSPSVNFSNTLAGRLPGLVAVDNSGEPGKDDATLRIRGSNTLGDNSPLIVVDGIANRNIVGLDPSDIESVTVLKDASAAIYGSEAANGVILITTKRGAIGKPKVNVNLNYGISMPTVIPKMADAATYATMVNEINSYAGQPAAYTAHEIQKYKDGSEPWLYPNTNWFDAVFKPSTPQTKNDISMSGGSESLKYFISTGFNQQDAIYKNSSAKYSEVNFRSNIDGKISKNIFLSFDISGRQENRDFADNPFSYLINRSKPMFIAFYPGNKPASGYQAGASPVILASDLEGYDRRQYYSFLSNMKLLVKIPWVKRLSVTGNVSVDKNNYNAKFWRTPYTLYSWDRVTIDANHLPVVTGALDGPYATPELTQNVSDGQLITLNALVNYDLSIANKHNIKFLAGAEKITGNSMDLMAFRRGFISTAIDQMFAGGDPDKTNGGSASLSARLDYFGRANYDFLEKYLIEFVWRYDGSYIFPAKGRFGFFPGVSVGWNISKESFWNKSLPFINYLKLRGSWGKTGNDRIDPYQYLSSYGISPPPPYIFNQNLQVQSLTELRIANPDVTWEVANQSNVGLDGQMFNGKLQFSVDYFYNLRTHILAFRNVSIPASTGLNLPRENIGEVINKGYEFQLGYNNKIGKLNFSVSINGSSAKNKIKFWDETPGVPEYQKSTGHPINAGLYFKALGIFKDQATVDKYPHWQGARPGDIIFQDINKDGKIDGLDAIRYDKTSIPTFTGGLSIDLGYKNFYTSILFQGAAGSVLSYNLESGLLGDFLADDANGRWTTDNINAKKPRAWNTGGEYWTADVLKVNGGTWAVNNTYFLKNNNYLRLKNIQIGYNIPKVLTDKLKIIGLSVYLSGLNLLTITSLKSFDPETVGDVYPLSKIFNVGIKLTF